MKPQTEQILTNSLTEILEFVKAGKSLAVEQGPLVVQEIVAYGRFEAIVWAVIYVSVAVVFFSASRRYGKWASGYKSDSIHDVPEPIARFGGQAVIWLVFAAMWFPMGPRSMLDVGKAWLAPRLYVIDYLKGLL